MRLRTIFLLAGVVVLLTTVPTLAWGPATHVKLAGDLLGYAHLLPAAIAALLLKHRKDFLFGNIAADVVLAKRLSRVRQICHHWDTGFALLDDARDEVGRAFAWGYLCHLAADTVAHNKFIPRQTALNGTTMAFGHLYWELRADSLVGVSVWRQVRGLLREGFDQHASSLNARLTDTFLPFVVNWRLFHRMNHLISRGLWRQVMLRWDRTSRLPLPREVVRAYRDECLERMIDVLRHGRTAAVLHEDPNGNAALGLVKLRKRQFRQLSRAGLITRHHLHEAARGHEPMPRVELRRTSAGNG